MSTRLFAYGTLRPGIAPAEIASAVATLRPVGAGIARGRVLNLGLYPAAVFTPRASPSPNKPDSPTEAPLPAVHGQVYEVPNPGTWQQLDAYECFLPGDPAASLFIRKRIGVHMIDTGLEIACWAYEYNRPLPPAR